MDAAHSLHKGGFASPSGRSSEVTWVFAKSWLWASITIWRWKKKSRFSLNSVPKLVGNQVPSGWGA